MNSKTIGFVGGGNLTKNLIQGLLLKKHDPRKILVSDLDQKKLRQLHSRLKVIISSDNKAVVQQSKILVLAVKPQVLKEVCLELKPLLANKRPLIVSVAAGVGLKNLSLWLGRKQQIMRAMPNLPVAIGEGITGLYAGTNVSQQNKKAVTKLFEQLGSVLWVKKDEHINTITSLCASGPGVIFLLIEALQEAGSKLGLSESEAEFIIERLILGATKMAMLSKHSAAELRRQVTSPKGTTERAIAHLEQNLIRELFYQAFLSAKLRCDEIDVYAK